MSWTMGGDHQLITEVELLIFLVEDKSTNSPNPPVVVPDQSRTENNPVILQTHQWDVTTDLFALHCVCVFSPYAL